VSKIPDVSVIVPIYNEEDIIWEMTEKLATDFNEAVGKENWCFIFVENGSTDSSLKICQDVADKWPHSKVVTMPSPNYGKALRIGLEETESPWSHIINIEQWDIPFFYWAWENREEYDLILGSKRADPTLNHQSPYRRFLSSGLNSVLTFFFEYVGADTHGPKLLKMETLRTILDDTIMNRGQFDTEFTLRTLREGLWVGEAPTIYIEHRPPRNFMISKIAWNIRDILKLRPIIKSIKSASPLKFHRWSRYDVLEVYNARTENKAVLD
jgi:glycosyltransferase involved in cell wall biosynthesis